HRDDHRDDPGRQGDQRAVPYWRRRRRWGPRDIFGRSEHGWWFDLECCDAEPDPVEPHLGPLDLRLDAVAERVVSDRRPGSRWDGGTGRSDFRSAATDWLVLL